MIYIVWMCRKCGRIQISGLNAINVETTRLKCKKCSSVIKLFGKYGFRVRVFRVTNDYEEARKVYLNAIKKGESRQAQAT